MSDYSTAASIASLEAAVAAERVNLTDWKPVSKHRDELCLLAACDTVTPDSGGWRAGRELEYQVKLHLLPLLEAGERGLQFRSVRYEPAGGWVEVQCGNHQTLEWLREQELFVGPRRFRVKFYPVCQYHLAALRLPCTCGRWSLGTLRRRCAQQNPGLDTRCWRLVARRFEPPEHRILLELDEESACQVIALGGQLHYQFGRIMLESFQPGDEFFTREELRGRCTFSEVLLLEDNNPVDEEDLPINERVLRLTEPTSA